MANNEKLKLTSVKVEKETFEEFKIEAIRKKFNMQKLVNRCMDLFVSDDEFAKKIMNHTNLVTKHNTL